LDQFWLKKIGKPMLTWITFPCIVDVFAADLFYWLQVAAGEASE